MTLTELNRILKYIPDDENLTIKELCEKYGQNLKGLLYEIEQIEVGGENYDI